MTIRSRLSGRVVGPALARAHATHDAEVLDDRAERALEAAFVVAESDATDERGLMLLRAMRHLRPIDFSRAAEHLRVFQLDTESALFDRTCRLLDAAGSDDPVEPIEPARAAFFAEIEALEAMPPTAAMAMLRARVPALADLERSLLARRDQLAGVPAEQRDSALLDEVSTGLGPLIGHGAPASPPSLVRSNAAFEAAYWYFSDLLGVPDDATG